MWGAARAGLRCVGRTTFVGVLDAISSTVAGAYSLRKLRGAYSGSAVNIRRSSDSTAMDVGFTASGDFDTATALAFVGSGSGFVAKWYDQSGSGKDMAQPVAANQPQIVGGGAVLNLGNSTARPAVAFVAASSTYLLNTSFVLSGGSYGIASVAFSTTASVNSGRLADYNSSSDSVDYLASTSVIFGYYSGGSINTYQASNDYNAVSEGSTAFQLFSLWTPSQQVLAINGGSSSASHGLATLPGTGSLYFGNFIGGNGYWDGPMAEHIVFGGALSAADQSTIQASQKSYYGTP